MFKEEIFESKPIRDLPYKMPAHLPLKQDDFIETILNRLTTIKGDISIVACYINVLIHHILEDVSIFDVKIESVLFEYRKRLMKF